jgi:hypothetical protein
MSFSLVLPLCPGKIVVLAAVTCPGNIVVVAHHPLASILIPLTMQPLFSSTSHLILSLLLGSHHCLCRDFCDFCYFNWLAQKFSGDHDIGTEGVVYAFSFANMSPLMVMESAIIPGPWATRWCSNRAHRPSDRDRPFLICSHYEWEISARSGAGLPGGAFSWFRFRCLQFGITSTFRTNLSHYEMYSSSMSSSMSWTHDSITAGLSVFERPKGIRRMVNTILWNNAHMQAAIQIFISKVHIQVSDESYIALESFFNAAYKKLHIHEKNSYVI